MKKNFSTVFLLCLFLVSCHRTGYQLAKPAAERGEGAQEAWGQEYVIASEGTVAARAAKRAFEEGGNIIDAFAAASFAISVERPFNSGLGGGGFALVHLPEEARTFAMDFREVAPEKATRDTFLDRNHKVIKGRSQNGPFASGVPGLVKGVLELHAQYGKLSRQKILAPAIRAAEDGVIVYPFFAKALEMAKEKLSKFPASAEIFLKPNGQPYKEGDELFQEDLAKTLREISKYGVEAFYGGWVARSIVSTQKKLGGLITEADLASYQAKIREPVKGEFKGYEVLSMPPPSSGGIHVIQMLQFLESDPLQEWGPYSAKTTHLVLEAMKRAFADRATHLGDSDFVDVPVQALTSKKYAQSLRAQVDLEEAMPSRHIKAGHPHKFIQLESSDTIHFTIVDKKGHVISSTQSINGLFGSGVVAKGTGIVLNNHMDDFSMKPGEPNLYGVIGGEANSVEGGKRPLSSMSPTIVFKNDKPILALGSPGGPRIITCVFQTILNYIAFDMSLYESVSSVRYHHQWVPEHALLEAPGFPSRTTKILKNMGHTFKDWPRSRACRVQAVAIEDGKLHGVSDPRRDGSVFSDLTPPVMN